MMNRLDTHTIASFDTEHLNIQAVEVNGVSVQVCLLAMPTAFSRPTPSSSMSSRKGTLLWGQLCMYPFLL
jgi:hypothetical protein